MKKLLLASSIVASTLAGTAFAQIPAPSATPAAPAASSSTTQDKLALKGTWRSSKLIGLDVYNQLDEKLGDIKEVLLSTDGKVAAVVIGVGGFLGMGEHDVAVTLDKLKFMETPRAQASARTDSKAADGKSTVGSSNAPVVSTTAARVTVNDWKPDHAVMQGTKDQLRALPSFKYSDYN